MRLVLDACVLFPTVLREILVGVAEEGLIAPLWSERILEEWRRAALRVAPEAAGVAEAEIAAFRQAFPAGRVVGAEAVEARLSLPDANDLHVLATAIEGRAEAIVTLNLRDFPGRTLARHGLVARSPDSLLIELAGDAPQAVSDVVEDARRRTEEISGRAQPLRPLLKRAKLPRLGKTLG